MARGDRSIFKNLFTDDNNIVKSDSKTRRGRSDELVKKRNELLIHRYYYYSKIELKQYENVLSELEKEFFLAPITIVKIVHTNIEMLKNINKSKPQKSYFKGLFPFVVW